MDINHKEDRQHSQDDGIHQEDNPQLQGHADGLDIVDGMGHQVPDFRPGEIGRGERLKVKKEAVSEGLLDTAGRSEEQNPPHISEPADPQSQCEDLSSIEKEV